MKNHKIVTLLIDLNLQLQLQLNSEFKYVYDDFLNWLDDVDDKYFSRRKVGEIQQYRFKNGHVIVYSVVSEEYSNGIKNYVIEIQDVIRNNVCKALNQNEEIGKKFWRIVQRLVGRAR